MVSFYAAEDARRSSVAARLAAGHALFAPAHFDAEVVSALRGLARGNPVLVNTAPRALAHLAGFPVRRMPLAPLLARMWRLRENFTPYDAAYVALAEQLSCTLITCDVKLANVSGTNCEFDVIA